MKPACLLTCLFLCCHVIVQAAQRKVLQAALTGSVQDLLPEVPGRLERQITDSSMSPYSAVGLLALSSQSYVGHCTAFLVAPTTAVASPRPDPKLSCLTD